MGLTAALNLVDRTSHLCYSMLVVDPARTSMKTLINVKVDRSALTVSGLRDTHGERSYWHARTPFERLQAVETLRQLNYGYDQSTARLQRVLEITQRAAR